MTRRDYISAIRGLLEGESRVLDVRLADIPDERVRTLLAVAESFAEVNAHPSRQRLIVVWRRLTGEDEHQLDRLLDEVYEA